MYECCQEHIMKFVKIFFPCLLALSLTSPAFADTTVNVKLWDIGGMMDMSQNMGMGMGMQADMAMAVMHIDADQASVPAGKVTFAVVNDAKGFQHEMLVAPIAGPGVKLPFVAAENRVDKEASGVLGEVSELDPGKSGALTIELKPGLYVLFCNIRGHFMAGMWTTLEVK
jgi:uncharacterized cupredoxin-like copper-binding protein